jgi:hypothetical protein
VFVTSQTYDANLGGLTGADSICQNLANAANLPGNYKAWLSDSNQTAAQRLTHSTVPYKLVDHTIVAYNWNGLTQGSLMHAIDQTESGGQPPNSPPGQSCVTLSPKPSVWTDTSTSGTLINALSTCSDWTSTSPDRAVLGLATATNSNWTTYCNTLSSGACAWQSALYCIQEP